MAMGVVEALFTNFNILFFVDKKHRDTTPSPDRNLNTARVCEWAIMDHYYAMLNFDLEADSTCEQGMN